MSQALPLPQDLQNNSIPLNTLAEGKTANDVLTWNGTEWVSAAPTGGSVSGTTNQITVNTVGDDSTISLPNTIITPGSLTTTNSISATTDLVVKNNSVFGAIASPSSNLNLTVSNIYYQAGTASQSGSTITGVGTTFTSAMIGMYLVFADGTNAGFIKFVPGITSLTVSTSQTVLSQSYTIYSYVLTNNSTTSNVGINTVAPASAFSVNPINSGLTFSGTVSQSGNTVTGSGTSFNANYLNMRLAYSTGVDGGVILAVNSSTSLTVSTSQSVASTSYLIHYPGFQVNSTGQSVVSGKAYNAENINTSTALSTYFDSFIDTSNGNLSCTLDAGISDQIKIVKLKNIRANTASVSCYTSGGGSFQLTPDDPVRHLRYNGNIGCWQIYDGISQTIPTPTSFFTTTQQGAKVVGTGNVGAARQGRSCALSADGNTLAAGGTNDNGSIGATWVYTRLPGSTTWSQQGAKLVGTGNTGASQQGFSCALSADGNTLAVGGLADNTNIGATWVFTRTGTTWTQQGTKLVGTGNTGTGQQGFSCALSADGNTLAVGAINDNTNQGATWIFTRSAGVWTQQAKLVGTGNVGTAGQGSSMSLTASGDVLSVGGTGDNAFVGATWIFTRSGTTWSQQAKLIGTGNVGASYQGGSCALSASGNTLAVGGYGDNSFVGAVWIFTFSGISWTQQGLKLVGTGRTGGSTQGGAVALTSDGNTLAVGADGDNSSAGALWIYTRSGPDWTQQGSKRVGTGGSGSMSQGISCAMSSEGNVVTVGGNFDNGSTGAIWTYM
jgi:hypothetical protein